MKYYSRMSLLALLAVIPFNGFSQEREVPIKGTGKISGKTVRRNNPAAART